MNVDQKIDALIARKRQQAIARTQTTQVPGQEAHEVTISEGRDKLAPSSVAGPGQVDVTIRSNNVNDTQAKRVHGPGVTQIVQPSNQPDEASVVTIGGCRLYPNPLIGTFEAQFTRGGTDEYVIEKDGDRLSASAGLKAIYDGLRAEQQKGGK